MPRTRKASAVVTNCGGLSVFRGRGDLSSADDGPISAQRGQVQQPHRDLLCIGPEAQRHHHYLPGCFLFVPAPCGQSHCRKAEPLSAAHEQGGTSRKQPRTGLMLP